MPSQISIDIYVKNEFPKRYLSVFHDAIKVWIIAAYSLEYPYRIDGPAESHSSGHRWYTSLPDEIRYKFDET